MIFNEHSNFKGCHAFLAASKYSWINYSPDKLETVWRNLQAKERGTQLHEFAAKAIEFNQRLRGSTQTLAMYVNDAIGYRMKTEQVLFYSVNCFGTADAISFRDNLLRIHDLKTGTEPASMHQLEIYAALFCLEYHYNPHDINIELRIYQNDEVRIEVPEPDLIIDIMNKIKECDKILENLKRQEV